MSSYFFDAETLPDQLRGSHVVSGLQLFIIRSAMLIYAFTILIYKNAYAGLAFLTNLKYLTI